MQILKHSKQSEVFLDQELGTSVNIYLWSRDFTSVGFFRLSLLEFETILTCKVWTLDVQYRPI